MAVAFTRQLGAQSGVQLNRLRDKSELAPLSVSDQVFGIAMRATRGRIDKAFKVDSSNVRTRLGSGEPIRVSALNEAMVHTVEALNQGAYEAVVSRLVPSAAKVKWAVCQLVPASNGTAEQITFTVSETEPESDFLFAIKHLECFNDGIKLAFHAESETVSGVDQPVSMVTVRILDKDDEVIHEFTGSLNSTSKDDYGQSNYLPDVIASQTDSVEALCVLNGEIQPTSASYGDNDAGRAKWATSEVLVCFDEGGFAYQSTDYEAACHRLRYTPFNFAYISSGGTRAPALLAQLANLAFNTNRQLRYDIHGSLTPEAAIAFQEQINMVGQDEAHLMQAYWAPVKTLDPAGINAKDYFGMATLNIAKACGRNAAIDSNGFAPKNYPIAGKYWPVSRQGMTQTYTPTEKELSALAKAKINPVLFQEYEDGLSLCVYVDSLTCAPVSNSLKMLQNVVDMATHTDEGVTRFCKACLQLPMEEAIKRIDDYLRKYFEGAEAAKWIKPSADPEMKGMAARWVVQPNNARPYDAVDVGYSVRYDGTNRATYVTQTITK